MIYREKGSKETTVNVDLVQFQFRIYRLNFQHAQYSIGFGNWIGGKIMMKR